MSTRKTNRPLRTLLLAGLTGAVLLVLRNVLADKGGSYDPAEAEARR